MKKFYLITLVLFVTAFASSCSKDDTQTNSAVKAQFAAKDLDESLRIFNTFKATSNNSYTYTSIRISFTGYVTETTLTVIKGNVTKRDYFNYQRDMASSSNARVLLAEWHESGASLGTHAEGAAVLNLDAIYTQAKNVWLKADTKTNDIYFEAKNNGLLSSAGYVLKGCMDDCFVGVNISAVTAL